jgi:hypothetical protein
VSALYRRGESSKRQGVNEELRGRVTTGRGSVSGGILGWSLKTRRADGWVPRVSEGKRERGYPFGNLAGWAVDLFWCWAEWVPRGLLSFCFLFFFSFSVFLISFFFAKFIQIKSNHFLKFSKIQHCALTQQEN